MSTTQIQPRSPRVPFVRPVHVSLHDGSDAQWLLASNLSRDGIFVRASAAPPVGTKLRLDLEARGQTLRFAEGEVVWSRPMDVTRLSQGLPGFAVKFVNLSNESSKLVKHLVDVGGTGRGQAKTVPFSDIAQLTDMSPLGDFAKLKLPTREPLHAPATAMVNQLTPTDRAPTGEWPSAPSIELGARPSKKVIVDLGNEPQFDAAALKPSETLAPPRTHARPRSSAFSTFAASAVLAMVIGGAGYLAYRGLHQARDGVNEPVTVVTANPTPEIASPEGAGDLTAAQVEPEQDAEPKPAVAKAEPKPAEKSEAKPITLQVKSIVAENSAVVAKVEQVETKPAPAAPTRAKPAMPARAQIALPSGAAKAVAVSEEGSALQIHPELASGASIDRVFTLSAPARLVIDLKGPQPKGTPRVEGRNGITAVRIGVRPGGTRLVLELPRDAAQVHSANGEITVELH